MLLLRDGDLDGFRFRLLRLGEFERQRPVMHGRLAVGGDHKPPFRGGQ